MPFIWQNFGRSPKPASCPTYSWAGLDSMTLGSISKEPTIYFSFDWTLGFIIFDMLPLLIFICTTFFQITLHGSWLTLMLICTSGGTRQRCKVTRRPLSKTKGRDRSPFSNMVLNVVKNLSIPVTVLHVTPMGSFRSDAHVGTWSDNPLVPDCSHWCLPGVPDMWNEILFSYLLSQESVSLQGNGNL